VPHCRRCRTAAAPVVEEVPSLSGHALRTEGPLYLNSGEEPMQHEAGAEGLSIPALNPPCGTHRGGSSGPPVTPVVGTSAGGKGRPTGSLTGTPAQPADTPSHTGLRPRAHEAVQRSKAVDGSGGGGETQTRRPLFWSWVLRRRLERACGMV
jgi:hypothetical protein